MCACECLCVHLTVCIITYQAEREPEAFLVSARPACFGWTVRVGTQAGLLWISYTQAGKVRFRHWLHSLHNLLWIHAKYHVTQQKWCIYIKFKYIN